MKTDSLMEDVYQETWDGKSNYEKNHTGNQPEVDSYSCNLFNLDLLPL